MEADVAGAESFEVGLGKAQFYWGYEVQCDVVEECEHGEEGVDGAAVEQVSDECDAEAGEAAEFFADGVEVGEGLGGVLAGAVASVDDRDGRDGSGGGGGSLLIVGTAMTSE